MAKHNDIHAELLGRITSGLWPAGAAIPNEADLALEFGCTRPTVARALSDLVKAGLIERRRRAGSRVVERRAREILLTIPLVRTEIEAAGRGYGYHLLGIERAPGSARTVIGPGEALHILCLHSADGEPYQLEDRWINLRTVPLAAAQDFAREGPNEWLVRTVPFTRAEHILSAAAAGPEEAERLGLATGAPVFVIERTTWLGEDPVTQVRLIHPGQGFRLFARDIGQTAPSGRGQTTTP